MSTDGRIMTLKESSLAPTLISWGRKARPGERKEPGKDTPQDEGSPGPDPGLYRLSSNRFLSLSGVGTLQTSSVGKLREPSI